MVTQFTAVAARSPHIPGALLRMLNFQLGINDKSVKNVPLILDCGEEGGCICRHPREMETELISLEHRYNSKTVGATYASHSSSRNKLWFSTIEAINKSDSFRILEISRSASFGSAISRP